MVSTAESLHSQATGSKDLSVSSNEDIGKVQTSGDNNEYVIIGNKKYLRSELMEAFGGTLNPGLSPPPVHQFANPGPLGLCGFGLTTLVLSLYNAQAMGIETPNVVVGLAAFYGGAIQLFAGMWEMLVGNTFGATALSSYGGFWLAYAAINIESFGIAAAYGDDTVQFQNAVGFFLLAWGLFTFMLTLCTLKSTVAFCSLFLFLTLTFFLLAAAEMTGKVSVHRAGGVTGVITGILGLYNAWAGVANKTNSYFVPYPLHLTRK